MTHRLLTASSLLLLLSLTAAATTLAAPAPIAPEPRLVRVTLDAGFTLERLLRGGFDVVGVQGSESASILEWPQDAGRVAALGARAQVLDEHPGRTAADAARADLAGAARLRSQPLRSGPERGATALTAPPFGSGGMGGYWTTAEIKMKLDDLVAGDTHDIVADKVDTVGVSREGRPVWGLEIGKHVAGPDSRPVVFYNALTHAREPGGMQVLFYFVDDLLSRYGTDPFATYLLNQRRIYIVPLVNPDGYAVNENTYFNTVGNPFGFWRKNTRDNNSSGTFESASDGVDLNRNFGVGWGYDDLGSSPVPGDDVYRGPSAFSEIETRVQRDLVAALKPATGLSFHTFQDILVHPWGYANTPTLDAAAFHEWDDLLSRFNGFQTGTAGAILYPVNGEFNDWCYGDTLLKPRAFTWTPEVGSDNDGFWPPLSRVARLAAENVNMCYRVAAIAGAYVRVDDVTMLEGAMNVSYFTRLSVRARNVGAGGPAGPGLTGTLTPLDPGVQMLASTVSYPTLASRTSANPSNGGTFALIVDDTVTVGRMIRFQIDFTDAGGLFSRDTLSLPVGTPTVLAADDASSGIGLWTLGGSSGNLWGVVTGDPSHPSAYFSDSPAGNYGLAVNWWFALTAPLDLSPGVHAYAVYDMRWEFERDHDAGLVEASLNGSTWTPLWATGSTYGDTLLPVAELRAKPVYGGTRWQWKTEWADLSPFTGSAGAAARFRYRVRSGPGGQYDGMSVDSIRILLYDPAAQPALVAVERGARDEFSLSGAWPNPARGTARFEFSLAERTNLTLDVLDLQGRVVRTLASGVAGAGRYARAWDLSDARGNRAAPGVYFVRLALPGRTLTRRFIVLG